MQALYFLCLLIFTILLFTASATNTTMPLGKPGCATKCGSVSVPYPFGIGVDGECSLSESYIINCNSSFYDPPKAFFGRGNIEVVDISINHGQLRLRNLVAYQHYEEEIVTYSSSPSISLQGFPLVFSDTENKLTVVGCDDYALNIRALGRNVTSGCISGCSKLEEVVNGSCSGVGCCQTSIPKGSKNFVIEVNSFDNHTYVSGFNQFGYAFVGEKSKFSFKIEDLKDPAFKNKTEKNVPIVLDWYVDHNESCSNICWNNTKCTEFDAADGFRCECLPGYEGNPYLTPGCTDVDECAGPNNLCSHFCINTPGSFICSCPKGYHGDGLKIGTGCISDPSVTFITRLSIGVGASLGSVILLLVGWWLHSFLKRRQLIKQQQINFEKNGGMLLRQQMSSDETIVERMKIFTMNELKKATDNFNEDRVLGQGGHGTVYKGMLGEGRIVAVKKSNVLEESQREEFINEVVVMSQISHRSILKLLGCCLENEVPLLVYEFIPNGTLFEHIHNPSEDFPITWKMRLQIASDTAGALAYLHSSTSTLIFHRDIKSSNILLDDKYRAKLSDFGTSRSVAIDQTHVVTRVMGTLGYLDPEYFQSQQFTEKSDVYSFGVVLVELITGQKAIRAESGQDRSLTSWFLSHMENSCVLEIVDSQVLQEGSKEELLTIAQLAMRCLHLDGKKRPTMKEVLLEIEAVLSIHMPQPYHPINVSKIEHASDGTSATTSTQFSSTFSLESTALDSPDLSLLFNPR